MAQPVRFKNKLIYSTLNSCHVPSSYKLTKGRHIWAKKVGQQKLGKSMVTPQLIFGVGLPRKRRRKRHNRWDLFWGLWVVMNGRLEMDWTAEALTIATQMREEQLVYWVAL